MSRDVKTIPDLWHEWHYGLNNGLSIVSINDENPGWVSNDKMFIQEDIVLFMLSSLMQKIRA